MNYPIKFGTYILSDLIQRQSDYFYSGVTRTYEFRISMLLLLRKIIQKHESDILTALYQDLRKDHTESYMSEIGFVYAEISDTIKHLKRWMKPCRVPSPLVTQPARSYILAEPLGRSLIISPWNYPFQLCISPLIGSMAAGNVCVIKPSEIAAHTSKVVERLINDNFPADYLHVITGGAEKSQELLDQRWDHIFFTGSTQVGKIVAAAAAKHLTPCTLELGGKSPCIVTKKARLAVAARRIVFGKFMNAGQTCVAPDYILVEDTVHDALVEALKKELSIRFGSNMLSNPQLPKIINQQHFNRLLHVMEPSKVVFGGRSDADQLLIEPTLMTKVKLQDPIMKSEIFGPLLPIVAVKNLHSAKNFILTFEKPLALYIFSESKAEQTEIIQSLSYGGGCINDTLIHLANSHLPFGGVGASGMGAYHGFHSFQAFSHRKAILSKPTFFDLSTRFLPWTKSKDNLFRRLLK